MWTRAELKTRAKDGLKEYYWYGVLAILMQGLLVFAITFVSKLIPLISFVISPLVTIFVTNIIAVGACSYFIKGTRSKASVGIGELFHGFQNGYMRVVGVQFFRSLFTVLWTLLLIVPGIMKHYEYYMVPYLVAEYPEKDRKEIFAMSKQMMDGNKFRTWVLELSFIGWVLLGAIACGIGILFVSPYMQATLAELYLQLKEERLGISRDDAGDIWAGDAVRGLNGQNNVAAVGQNRGLNAPGSGFLVGVQGEFAGANIPIALGETLKIGRDSLQCNVVIQGEQTSRLHLTVAYDGNAFIVTDQSSLGTFDLEKGRLPKGQPVVVQPGAYLQLGTGGDVFRLEKN